nr:hypothetical protein [Tanacetum cinerariifolium]
VPQVVFRCVVIFEGVKEWYQSTRYSELGLSGELDGTPTLSDGRDTTKTVETTLVFVPQVVFRCVVIFEGVTEWYQSTHYNELAETFDCDEEEVSDDEDETHVKVPMPLADDELPMGKNHARNGSEPQAPLAPLKNLQGASPSSEVRGGSLAESSQFNESSIRVSCITYGSSVYSPTDHNDFDHFKKEIQGTNLVPGHWMLKEYGWCEELSTQICKETSSRSNRLNNTFNNSCKSRRITIENYIPKGLGSSTIIPFPLSLDLGFECIMMDGVAISSGSLITTHFLLLAAPGAAVIVAAVSGVVSAVMVALAANSSILELEHQVSQTSPLNLLCQNSSISLESSGIAVEIRQLS